MPREHSLLCLLDLPIHLDARVRTPAAVLHVELSIHRCRIVVGAGLDHGSSLVRGALTRYEQAGRLRIGGTTQLPPYGGVGSSTHESAQTSWCLDELMLIRVGHGRSARGAVSGTHFRRGVPRL